ncbi:MAG: cystathionine gamma-synthase family protein [Nitrososphaeria archaeon]|nr:cystathionine gamma-synthase family protein [Nitrososphaeria archaeon]MDW8021878.1 cystathionine gamma-synthase family protein [Nitrososphaerota archaeon]
MPKISTDAVHGHGYYDEERGVFKVPIYPTAVYEHPDRRSGRPKTSDRGMELKYSREENLTARALEKLVAKLEKGVDSLAFNSGMAAISTAYISRLKPGDRILVPKECYGTTQQLAQDLSKFGVECVLARSDTEEFLEKLESGVSLALIETITNPMVRVVDAKELARRCSELGIPLIVDNTFATPILYNPLEDGAWVALHSMTKYLSGHNDVVGGVIVVGDGDDLGELWEWRRKLGTIISPFDAFLIIRGISTLKPRFEAQSRNALAIAEFLSDHPKVRAVYYPGLPDSPYKSRADRIFKERLYGGVLSFEVRGDQKEALKLLSEVRIIKPSPSLGGTETLITYPIWSAAKSMPRELLGELGITEGLLRLSLGLEDVEDLKEDLDRALSSI